MQKKKKSQKKSLGKMSLDALNRHKQMCCCSNPSEEQEETEEEEEEENAFERVKQIYRIWFPLSFYYSIAISPTFVTPILTLYFIIF